MKTVISENYETLALIVIAFYGEHRDEHLRGQEPVGDEHQPV